MRQDRMRIMYRQLNNEEINALKLQGCMSNNWETVLVSEDFDCSYVRNVCFSGNVRLGSFRRTFTIPGGSVRHSGVYNACLHNVEIEDDCFICNVNGHISNYVIGRGCMIFNIGSIYVDGRSSFGNGVDVSVLNELGGREIMIYDNLSAHQAFLMAMYRNRPCMVEKLRGMIGSYVESIASGTGKIGEYSSIINTTLVDGVKFGPYSVIEGASRLRNGSVNSTMEAPVYIGTGVVADDFIICSGSSLRINAAVERCFVGQSCELTETYFASDSVFFANCFGGNGEACAVFAGPFTVTHHKSTLLIAGMFSFMNAGSGSNQSNHLYKLGPMHCGVLERGSKTTSDSYILWPARTGAFTLVMGRHVHHLDSSMFPFSYLIERQGISFIFPGANLKSVGTIRDVKKWPKRDKREGRKLDCINFNLLSPYTMAQALSGLGILKALKAENPGAEIYAYKNACIKSSSLQKGIRLYEMMADKFLGNSLISRIQKSGAVDLASLHSALRPDIDAGRGDWEDLSGLLAPASEVEKLILDIENGVLTTVEEVGARFEAMHADYYSYEWTWAYSAIMDYYGVDLSIARIEAIKGIIAKWKESVLALDEMLYADAEKELRLAGSIGHSSGDSDSRMADDPFVNTVREHVATKTALYNDVLDFLDKIN